MISMIKKLPLVKLCGATAIILSVAAVTACGGGGGDPGSSNATATANRFTLSMVTRPTTSVFLGGTNTTAYISLAKTCTDTACGNLPLDNVSGQVVTLTSSDPTAVTFSPATAVTDSEGNAQIVISSASRDVSGLVNITASAKLSGHTYTRAVALRVNSDVDRTITTADDSFFQVLDQTKDCSNYQTFIVNVKNPAGVLQNNSEISIDSISFEGSGSTAVPLAEAGLKDLGVFNNLGRVWLLQVRPPALTCSESGTTTKIGDVIFSVSPGDGSAPYSIGYKIQFKST